MPHGFVEAGRSEHLVFRAPEPGRTGGRDLASGIDFRTLGAVGDETVERVAEDLDIPPGDTLSVYLAPASAAERADLPLPPIPDWAAGVAYGASGQIVLVADRPRSYPDDSLSGLLAHEVAHVMFDRALAGSPHQAPRWFEEGYAVLEARPWGWRDAIALGTAILPRNPPPLSTLERTWPREAGASRAAYAISVSFVSHLEREAGEGAVRRIAYRMREGDPFDVAVARVAGAGLEALEADWRRGSAWFYRWIPLATSSATVWFVALALLFVAAVKKRARRKALEERWEETDLGERHDAPQGRGGNGQSGPAV